PPQVPAGAQRPEPLDGALQGPVGLGGVPPLGGELGRLDVDAAELVTDAELGGQLAGAPDEPFRRIQVALQPQRVPGPTAGDRLCQLQPGLAGVAGEVDGGVERLVDLAGGDVELDQAPARLDQIFARAQALEQDLARLVTGAGAAEVALPGEDVAAVAAGEPE